MVGFYNYPLVALSYFIAVIASYVTLDLAGRLRSEINASLKKYWIVGGAFIMGSGIWSMHFIGMLAYIMPMPPTYDILWTSGSLLIAIIASFIALFILRKKDLPFKNILLGGVVMGCGIAAMHYMGMEAMEGPFSNPIYMKIDYLPGLFFLSIFVAIIASQAALWLAVISNQGSLIHQLRLKIASALVMGAAICGMHYIGMAAAVMLPVKTNSEMIKILHASPNLSIASLALYIYWITGLIIIIALIVSTYRQMAQAEEQQNLLEIRVKERTAELSDALEKNKLMQDHLIQVEKMATVGQLTAGLAHEINNPLSYALSNMTVLDERLVALEKHLPPNERNQDTHDLITETEEGLLRIKKIISDVRGVSSEKKEELQPVDINTCIESAVELAWNKIKDKCVLQKKLDPSLPKIMGYPNQITQVFMSLILNAVTAIKEKGEINFVTIRKDASIIIIITDTGCGIEPENLKKIFNPFFTTKGVGYGQGLSLSRAYEIIQSLKGTITVTSKVDQGTTFTIELPISN